MNGGKGGREGNDVAARLAVAGLTIQQATVVHPPGMAWLGDGLRVRRLGLTTNTRFLTPSPSEILLDLDLVVLALALASPSPSPSPSSPSPVLPFLCVATSASPFL